MRARILLIEDESALVTIVTDLLRAEAYAVETASDGRTGSRRGLDGAFDLVVLDLMLPGMDVADRVRGLRIAADDYLSKPLDCSELLARISSLLRRVHKEQLTPVIRFKFGGVAVDFAKREVCRDGEPVSLAAKESQLLRYLIDHRGQSREFIHRRRARLPLCETPSWPLRAT
jgi:DNA-binding response OmpR family regulator